MLDCTKFKFSRVRKGKLEREKNCLLFRSLFVIHDGLLRANLAQFITDVAATDSPTWAFWSCVSFTDDNKQTISEKKLERIPLKQKTIY